MKYTVPSMEEIKAEAMKRFEQRAEVIKTYVESEKARHNQEIREYIDKAVTDIARKCGMKEDEIWEEVKFWSRFR